MILAAWPFWLDGAQLREWAVAGLFPAGQFVDSVVGLARVLTAMLASSDAVAISGALGVAFTLSTLVAVAQGTVVVTFVWLIAGAVARLRRKNP